MRLSRPTIGGSIAVVALLAATGGTSYAAAALAKNSVGNYQMKDNAIKTAEVYNGSLGLADLSAGAKRALLLPGSAPSKGTQYGVFGVDSHATGAGQDFSQYVSYAIPFASALTAEIVSGPATANCPGSDTAPKAAPGHLCLYPSGAANVASDAVSVLNFGKLGFEFSVTSTGTGNIVESGTWAATAP